MTPHIYRFPGHIWRVIPDPVRPGLALEYRKDKQVGWAWLPAHLPLTPVWIEHPEPWYAGLEGVWDGIVLLHGYEAPDWPVRQGVWAYDGPSGQLVWDMPALKLLRACNGGFYLQDSTGDLHACDQAGKPVNQLAPLMVPDTLAIGYPARCAADALPALSGIRVPGSIAYQSGDWTAFLRDTPDHQASPILMHLGLEMTWPLTATPGGLPDPPFIIYAGWVWAQTAADTLLVSAYP